MTNPFLEGLKQNKKRGKIVAQEWTLKEVLAVMYMAEFQKLSKTKIAAIIGRTAHQISYHVLEGVILVDGRETRRSAKAKYFVGAKTIKEAHEGLFQSFKVEYRGLDQVKELIQEFKRDLEGREKGVA